MAKKGAMPLTEAEFALELGRRLRNNSTAIIFTDDDDEDAQKKRDIKNGKTAIKAFKEEVIDCLTQGYSVPLSGLVKFVPIVKAGRKKGTVVRNPSTGAETTLKADEPDVLTYRLGKSASTTRKFPSLRSKAGQELHAQLFIKPKPAKKKVAA